MSSGVFILLYFFLRSVKLSNNIVHLFRIIDVIKTGMGGYALLQRDRSGRVVRIL